MAIASTLKEYLDFRKVDYEIIAHRHTESTLRAAESAHIPGDVLAKPVLLGDEHSYLLAVIPATHRLALARLVQVTARLWELVPETEMIATFSDCECGAIPPIGEPYGIDTILDLNMARSDEVYFESGDHEHLVHMRGEDFRQLLGGMPRAEFSHHL
jgi:Ala-tRNA(Pro) deacylase